MTDQQTTGRSASRQDAAPDTDPTGRSVPPFVQAPATTAILSSEQLLRIVRTGVIPPG